MGKILRIMLLAMAVMLPWAIGAQTHYTLQIGYGTATSNYVPSYGYYNYSYTQSLYTAGEVGIDGTIDSLSFQVANNSLTRSLTIYMAEVSQTNMASAVPASAFSLVYTGSVNFAPGWVTIALDTAFDYQDTGSLVIAVIDGTGTYNYNRPYFSGTEMNDTRARYAYNDNNSYTLSSSLDYNTSFLPNIRLGISSYSTYCAQPSDVTVTNIENDDATISWTENGNATTYELVVSDTPVTDFSLADAITVYDTFYTVSGLDGNTLYYVYVRAMCDASSASGWTSAATFRSACVGYTSVPYTTGFEGVATGDLPNCWQQITANQSNSGSFPSAYAYATNARNGNVYFEFESSNGGTEVAALPAMDNLNSLMLTFYAACMNANFMLEAGVMEESLFVPIDTVQLTAGSNNNWHGSYYPYTVYFNNYSGNGERIALRVTSSGSYTLMIDDLSVDYIPTCPPPSNGSIDSTGNDWIAFSWHENGNASSWEVAYGTGSFTPDEYTTGINVYDNSYTMNGLSGDSAYTIFVRSDCGSDYSAWVEVGTAQPGIYVMTLSSDTLYTCGATIFDNGGPNENYSGSSNNTLVVFPASSDSTLRIWGTVNTESNYDYVAIYDGVGTTGTQLFYGSGSANVGPFVSMAQAITIQFTSDGSVNYAGFELHASCVYMSGCTAPLAFAVDSVLGDTVWLSWMDTAYNSSFEIAYGLVGFNPDTATVGLANVSVTNEMLTGLTMGQQYEFYLRADCGNEQSMWVGPVTATPGYSYNMAAIGSDTIHVCGYTIYDDGGEAGDYSSDCNSTLVVFPNDPTQTLQISGTGYVEASFDHLYIYDGVGTTGTLMYHGQGNFTMPVTNSEEGAVTIVFTSDDILNYSGYELNVACIPLPDCPHPAQMTVSNIGTQGADISWTENGTASSWILQYDTVDFIPGASTTANSVMVFASPYTLYGLDSGMTYYVYVASYCNPDTSDFVGLNFTTLAATPASLPFSCDFEQPGANGWDLFNGTQTNKWMIGSGANNGGSRGLYISNDNSTNNYDVSSSSVVFASRTLYFDSVGEYAYSFDWRSYGESYWDYLRAALVPSTIALNAGYLDSWSNTSLPNGAIALDGGNELSVNGSWISRNGTVNVSNTGAYNIVFMWKNDNMIGTQPPAAIDNVMINRLSCPSPTNLAITRLTSDSVFLSWNGNGSTGPWIITYDNNASTVYDSSAAIGGLVAGTLYTFSVATLCGSDSSFFVSIQATPGSWNMRPNQTDTLHMCGGVIYDDGGSNGEYSGSQDSYIILYPDAPNNIISVSGSSYTEGSYDYLRIYDGVGAGGTELWNDYGSYNSQSFGPIESLSGPLTIYFHSDGSLQYDGFAINVNCVSVSCRVMNLHLNAGVPESGSQLAVTWDAVTDAQSYQIEYGAAGFSQGTGQFMSSNTNSVTITGLMSLTSYDVYVRSLCLGGDTGSWTHATFGTAMCDNPTIAENFDSTMTATQDGYYPIGYSFYNNSYVQTIIPASRLADIAGDITALAFHPASTAAGNYFTGMSVFLANISEDRFTNESFFVEDATHHFTQVINNADFSYNDTDWQIHGFDSAFVWDGQSNVLVAIIREHGSYSSGALFSCHVDSVARTCYDYDDYEDYDLTYTYGSTTNTVGDLRLISCGGGCARPGGLYATNVNYNSATLNWSGSAANYEVALKRSNEALWPTETAVSGTTYNVTSLYAGTTYQFRVRAICDAAENLISDWTVGSFVTDSLPCFAPSTPGVTASYTTATFNWTVNGEENLWNIHVWNTNFDTVYTVGSNPATVGGLAAAMDYSAAVSALCGGGAVESEAGDTIGFTTAACTETVSNVQATNVTAHTATITWNGNVNNYIIRYDGGEDINVTGTTYTYTGLQADYPYTVYVRAVCAPGVNGSWSAPVSFITGAQGIVNAEGMQVTVYPNPASSATTIALSGVNGEVRVTIVDMNGRTVMSEVMECEGDCAKTIEVSDLAQGAYFVRVNGENVNMVKKLVVK